MNLRRRLFPPRQTARCGGCGVVITERRRRPCPVCDSINRHVAAIAIDQLGADDKVG